MSEQAQWAVGEIPVRLKDEQGPAHTVIAGWVKGLWALDFRVFDESRGWDDELCSGWMLTHIPTGFCAFGILAPLPEAQEIADEIDGMADWSFTDPDGAKNLKGVQAKVREEFEGRISASTLFCRGPMFGLVPDPRSGEVA